MFLSSLNNCQVLIYWNKKNYFCLKVTRWKWEIKFNLFSCNLQQNNTTICLSLIFKNIKIYGYLKTDYSIRSSTLFVIFFFFFLYIYIKYLLSTNFSSKMIVYLFIYLFLLSFIKAFIIPSFLRLSSRSLFHC